MAAEDRVRWDKIYRQRRSQPYPAPDPLLYEYTPPVPPDEERRALDLAAGLGQNGLWLAGQGYIVDIMDISRVALNRARAELTSRNLRNANLLMVDLDSLELNVNYYDVLCVFRYLKRSLWDNMKNAVKPGGRFIYESFNLRYLELVPEFNTSFLLHHGELKEVFSNWNIVFESEDDHISQIVAIKPPEAPLETDANIEKPPDLNW
jgi:tellurite methyltransferase